MPWWCILLEVAAKGSDDCQKGTKCENSGVHLQLTYPTLISLEQAQHLKVNEVLMNGLKSNDFICSIYKLHAKVISSGTLYHEQNCPLGPNPLVLWLVVKKKFTGHFTNVV